MATESEDDLDVRGAAGAGFETVLASAAYGGVGGLVPPREIATLVGALARRPGVSARRAVGLARSLAKITVGGGTPGQVGAARDSRFADRAWQENPLFRRLALAYLASCEAAEGTVDDLDLDWRTRERLRMPLENLLAALSPTNNPAINPQGWKEALDTGGASLPRGFDSLVRDLATPTHLPSSVDREGFELGKNLAATPGKVVRRERLYELIEYTATTDKVDAVPIVFVPSPVNKFYLLDLGPGESVVAELVAQGRRVFVPSWVQPDPSHADVGFDAYVASIVEVLETAAEISGSKKVHLFGLCGGGELVTLTAAYLAAIGEQKRLASLTIGIAVLDFQRMTPMAFLDQATGERAIARAAKRGHFSAAESARSFALMRPIEGIWDGAVNNYVLGRKPPSMGLLYWAADQTNMATQFGADMIRTAVGNLLTSPGALKVLGEPIDLSKITVDTYLLGASTDHISPWKDCFRTLPLLGGSTRWVLARGGHAIIVARPPSHRRAAHWVGDVKSEDPDVWFDGAERRDGSWWNDWSAWITKLTPRKVPAPAEPGSAAHPPLVDAPGTYVRVLVT